MAKQNIAVLLQQLEQARSQIGSVPEAEFVRLLTAAGRLDYDKDAASLIRFHDLCLFLRAFPPGPRAVQLTERLLAGVEKRVKAALAAGADAELFAPEEVAGMAGTVVEGTFSYALVCWLVESHPRAVSINWKEFERETQRAVIWPRFLPLLEEDSLTEANVPYLDWLAAARGRRDDLPFLVRSIQRLPVSEREKGALYDSLELMVRWDMSGSTISRTLTRKPVRHIYCHVAPLITRRQVSLADELAKPALPVKILPRLQAGKILDLVKAATGVRYRELYGTSNGDPAWVVSCNPGRGVEMYFWGLPPELRLPLRAYLAGFTVKNGVPINYIEGISLFDWMEIGFNTFPAYRDGETAWIYAQALRLFHQLHGVRAMSVYPYQIGDGNEEAIASGAFWFYRKLGFRSMDPELEKLALAEEKKVLARPGYRTPARTLRRLSKAHVVYEMPGATAGAWDHFSTRNLGLALQQRMAQKFDGDGAAMTDACVARLASEIQAQPRRMSPNEKKVFADFAQVCSLIPDLHRWTPAQKTDLRAIIAAKSGATEQPYMRLLQAHERLRSAVLRLGSRVT